MSGIVPANKASHDTVFICKNITLVALVMMARAYTFRAHENTPVLVIKTANGVRSGYSLDMPDK